MGMPLVWAILAGGYFWLANLGFLYGAPWTKPLFVGVIAGLIFGDMETAVKTSVYLQFSFLPMFWNFGNLLYYEALPMFDPTIGSLVACFLAIAKGIDMREALILAQPMTLILSQLHLVRRIWFSILTSKADNAAKRGDSRAIVFYATWACVLSKVVLYWIPTTLMMISMGTVGDVYGQLPAWVGNAFSVAGSLLPALGITITLRFLGKPRFLPFFLGGYFLTAYEHIGGALLMLAGLMFAFLYFLILSAHREKETAPLPPVCEIPAGMLGIKDVFRVYFRWQATAEMSVSYSHCQALSVCFAFLPVLQKLYGKDPQEYRAALERHLSFFCAEGIWAGLIHGIALSVEEKHAMGAPIDASAVVGVKTGLMAAVDSVGSVIDGSFLFPLVSVYLLPMAKTGSPLAGILQFAIVLAVMTAQGAFLCRIGYRYGSRAMAAMPNSRFLKGLAESASVLGLFMLGGVAASYLRISTPLYIGTSGSPFLVQRDLLDRIAPGILALPVIFAVYRSLQKGSGVAKAAALLILCGLLLGSAGILGNGGLIFRQYVQP